METVAIVCPGCHARFTLKAKSISAMSTQTFRCTKCGYAAPFGNLVRRQTPPPIPEHLRTQIGTAGAHINGMTTRVAPSTEIYVIIEAVESGRRFRLKRGIYTIGRDSSDSRAALRIAPDKYISRLHAEIEHNITPSKSGAVTIRSLSPKNALFINNRKIEAGGRIALADGDKILIGMTTVTVRIEK